MSPILRKVILVLATTAVAGSVPSSLAAQNEAQQATPKGWNYEVDSRGNRVAKDRRINNPDGSWREEIRQGNCITVKDRAATGEYKETRQCTPAKTG